MVPHDNFWIFAEISPKQPNSAIRYCSLLALVKAQDDRLKD